MSINCPTPLFMTVFKHKISKVLLSVIAVLAFVMVASAQNKIEITSLSCNNLTNPTGIVGKPVFGWKMQSPENNKSQTAYQILVASSKERLSEEKTDIWDSKKINSEEQFNIKFSGKPLKSSTKYFWKLRMWDENGKVSLWSAPASFITALLKKEDFKAKWITNNKRKNQALPLLRKSFRLQNNPEKAIIHISGLGYYELYVNGNKVGDHVLDPGRTNYDDYTFYVTYDITSLLNKGNNTIGVMLGDGWFNQDRVWGGMFVYGSPMLWCQLDMAKDGKTERIISDASWQWVDGPILSSNVFAGEVYDARKEIEGWAANNSNTGKWKNVALASEHPTTLVPQNIPPIKKIAELKVKSFYKSPSGAYIFDFGQNFAGWNRLKIKAPSGTEITLKMAEEKDSTGNLNYATTGVGATGVIQTEKYICKGIGEELWEPRFTYHGYRYVEVDGLPEPPTKDLLTGIVVHSAVPKAGEFSCSNPQINKLHKLSYWSFISNLHSVPTDCPHREKAGWLGDAHAMAEATIFNFDMQAFWLKYLDDIRSTGRLPKDSTLFHVSKNSVFRYGFKEAGIPYMIAPGKRESGVASADWGTAVVQIPWFLYRYYGNKEAILKFYPDMKRWVNYVGTLTRNHIIEEGLGDWCPPGGVENMDCPVALSSTAFHYNDLKIMEKVAGILTKTEDAAHFSKSAAVIKKAFIGQFFDIEKNSFGSQTGNAMALDFGLVPEGKEGLVADAIVEESEQQFHGFENVGIFGLQRLFGQLSKYGNEQAAFNILNKKGDYSFELMWKKFDATTLWEILPVNIDFTDAIKGITKSVSHNHAMQGGFDAWFFNGILGIAPDKDLPGFKKIVMRPRLLNQLAWAKGSYNSVYGEIKSSWKWHGKKLIWNIEVPVNTTAEIILPQLQFKKMQVDGKDKEFKTENSTFSSTLASGIHTVELR